MEAPAAEKTLVVPVKEVPAPYDKYEKICSNKPIKAEKEWTWSEMLFGEAEPTEFQKLASQW